MIEHEGIIISATPEKATVQIINQSACVSCQLKGKCNLSDMKEKNIDVNTGGVKYEIGDNVTIIASEVMGFKAIFLGYLLPFIIMVSTVVILTFFNFSELIAGLVGLSTLIPYYIAVKLLQNRIAKHFSFYLKNK